MRLAMIGLLVLCALPQAVAADAALDAVFQRMNRAAAQFKGLTANIRRLTHQDVIDVDTVETGTVAVRRAKPRDTQYLWRLDQVDPPKKDIVSLTSKKLQIYYPAINTVQEGDLTRQFRNKAEQFLALGFGTNSDELQANYTVSYGGPETINGQKTTRLDLVPKSQEVLQMYKKISLWVADDTGVAVQLKLYEPGMKDYNLATYSNVKLGDVPESAVKLDLPKDVKHDVLH